MKWLKAALCVGCAVSVLPMAGKAGAGERQQAPFASFPLYKDVVGGPFATLGEGRLPNKSRWGAYASRLGDGKRGYEQPCLSLARITRFGEYSAVHGCSPLVPTDDEAPPNYVYIAASSQLKKDGPVVGESVMGLSFKPGVRSVVLRYTNGGQLTRRTRLFNASQQRKTKLTQFRYVAFAVQADVCVESVIGFSKSGDELLSAATGLC
jgi:hypothetical protein